MSRCPGVDPVTYVRGGALFSWGVCKGSTWSKACPRQHPGESEGVELGDTPARICASCLYISDLQGCQKKKWQSNENVCILKTSSILLIHKSWMTCTLWVCPLILRKFQTLFFWFVNLENFWASRARGFSVGVVSINVFSMFLSMLVGFS